jgi:hypothetical protein
MPNRRKIKIFIIFEGSNRNPNPFKVFTGGIYSIYRQNSLKSTVEDNLTNFSRQLRFINQNQANDFEKCVFSI